MGTKFYHCTRRRLTVGTILVPNSEVKAMGIRPEFEDILYEGDRDKVYLTNSPLPHYTFIGRLDKLHVYEVRPLGKEMWFGGCDEIRVDSAVIVRYVGKASGIARNHAKAHFGKVPLNSSIYKAPMGFSGVSRNEVKVPKGMKAREGGNYYRSISGTKGSTVMASDKDHIMKAMEIQNRKADPMSNRKKKRELKRKIHQAKRNSKPDMVSFYEYKLNHLSL